MITGRLPGAKAINALIQAEKNPDNEPGRLIRIIKEQRRGPIGGATIRDMMIQKKSFLVLGWPLRAVNAKGSTKTFQMMVNEQGWTNIEERSYYGSSEPVSSPTDTMNIISRLQRLEKLIVERRRRDMDDSPVSVHIWMSLYDWVCMRGCGWQVTANPIIDSLQKTITRQHVQGYGCGVRESRCSFPWWKRGLGDDCQQGGRDLQGGRRIGDRE